MTKKTAAAAALAGALAASGIAGGAIPADDGTITVCYRRGAGSVRVVDARALESQSGDGTIALNLTYTATEPSFVSVDCNRMTAASDGVAVASLSLLQVTTAMEIQ